MPRVETAEESVPDWAGVIPSEAAAPQPSVDEPGGNESVHAPPTLCVVQVEFDKPPNVLDSNY
jgi:hypothetical protein